MALIHNFTYSQCLRLLFPWEQPCLRLSISPWASRWSSPLPEKDHFPADTSRRCFSDFLQPSGSHHRSSLPIRGIHEVEGSVYWILYSQGLVYYLAKAGDFTHEDEDSQWALVPGLSDCRMLPLPCPVDTSNTAFQKIKPDPSYTSYLMLKNKLF